MTRNRDGVPGWSGDPSTWLEFKQAARLYVASTTVDRRYTCGPRVAAELSGAAKTAILGKKSSWLSDSNGTETLLQFLQTMIGEPALPEVGNFMRQYFRVLKRKRGESMSSFCVRHRDEYEKMCRALARMLKENKQKGKDSTVKKVESQSVNTAGSNTGDQEGSSERSESARVEPGGREPEENGELPWGSPDQQWWQQSSWRWGYDWRWNSGSWYGSSWPQPWGSHLGSTTQEENDEDEMEQILPDAVLGWFLLEKTGLDPLEKSIIQGEIKGNFTLAGVENALRSHWTDDQIRTRDGESRHQAQFQDEEEDEPIEDDHAMFEGWSEDEMSWYQDAKAEEQRAWMQLQQSKRTLREARARQHEVKMSRKFYKTSWQSKPPGGQGRGNGPVGASSTFRAKDACFRCGGRGHIARNCPNPPSQEAKISEDAEEEDLAEFTYFTKPGVEEVSLDREEQEKRQLEQISLAATTQKPSTEQAIVEGKAVIDGGATKTMGSLHAVEALSKRWLQNHGRSGVKSVDVHDQPVFGFGNSQKSKCLSTCVMKVPSQEAPMNLRIHVLEQGRAPILLSIDSLRAMGAIIDYARDEAVFTSIDPSRVVQLERSQVGHQLLPLAEDFLKGGRVLKTPINDLGGLKDE